MTMNENLINDLGIDAVFIKGRDVPVRNCWHFFSDGDNVDAMFYDEHDFRLGMNRIYVTIRKYDIMILAFVLMDTHFHFVLYGDYDKCKEFVHDYFRRTSKYISATHGDKHKLKQVAISHQVIDTDAYLKTVICYVIKNPTSARMPYLPTNYPWSSGPLYFEYQNQWCSRRWKESEQDDTQLTTFAGRTGRKMLGSHNVDYPVKVYGDLILPEEYVAYKVVEKIFGTHKAFFFFLSLNKDQEIEANGGAISRLTMPIQEMRQQRDSVIRELFGDISIRDLSIDRRLKVAKVLRSRFNSSPKQIARVCCLVYEDLKGLL